MAVASWIWGWALTAALVVPVAWSAWRVRRRLLGDWAGAPARLAESVVALAALIGVAQVVGAVGAFDPAGLIVGTLVVAAVAGTATRGLPASAAAPRASHEVFQRRDPITSLACVTAVAIAVGRWFSFTVESLRFGILDSDSIWYHLTRAARFAQTGWVTRLHYTAPEFPDTFHPANAELVQAIPMVLFHRDLLAGVLNLGWLLLILLAAWCLGRPFGQARLSLLGAAALLATPLFLSREAGNAGNDIVVMFFLVAAVALLAQPEGGSAQTCLAGVAAGLAIATKLTVVPLVLVLTVGVVAVGPGRTAVRRAVAWSVPLVALGGYWYIRNWVTVRSPVPATHLPLFPSPSFKIADDLGFSVADYLTNTAVWRDWFLPGLRADFGLAYPLVAGLLVVAAVAAVLTRSNPYARVVGVALVVGTAVYVVLPTTALGERGAPVLFASNVAYLAPVLLLAMTFLPVLATPSSRVSHVLTGAFGAVLVLGSMSSTLPLWGSGASRPGVLVVAVVATAGVVMWWHRPPASSVLVAGATVAGILAVALVVGTADSRAARYAGAPFYRWAVGVSDARIAIAGLGKQYPFYGYGLDNWVQYMGVPGRHGAYHDIGTCTAWRAALRHDRVGYVVLRSERSAIDDHQLVWTRTDPAARLVLRADGGFVFAFDPGVPDPGCRGLPGPDVVSAGAADPGALEHRGVDAQLSPSGV